MRFFSKYMICFGILIIFVLVGPTALADGKSFSDVKKGYPNYEEIMELRDKGFISGYPDGTFRPNEKITRKHAAALLDKALNLPEVSSSKVKYKDVPLNHPNYKAIMKLTHAGIFSGDNKGNFNPDASITRVEMAKVMDIAFDLDIYDYHHFNDVSSAYWGYLHVQALAANGITKGNLGNFMPGEPITRAHYSLFLHRALKFGVIQVPDEDPLLSKREIFDLVYRVPHRIGNTMLTHKMKKSPFETVQVELLDFGTASFVKDDLKVKYDEMCTRCDMMVFAHPTQELNYRFEIAENTPSRIVVKTVAFNNMIEDGGFISYTFEKSSANWKLAAYDFENIGAGSFELTEDEATNILLKDFKQFHSKVMINYQKTTTEKVNDWYTKKAYDRLVYHFIAHTDKGNFPVKFYPHNGLSEY